MVARQTTWPTAESQVDQKRILWTSKDTNRYTHRCKFTFVIKLVSLNPLEQLWNVNFDSVAGTYRMTFPQSR